MAVATTKIHCSICNEEEDAYECKGCLQIFCFQHLTEHREIINKQFNQFEDKCNIFRQDLIDQKHDPNKNLLIQRIDQWEKETMKKIKQTADECRQTLIKYTNEYMIEIENKLNDLSEQVKQIRKRNKFNEIDLNQLNDILIKLKKELDTPSNVSIKEETTSFVNKISISLPSNQVTKWKQVGLTIAGGNGPGNQSNQLNKLFSLCMDNDQTLYIADTWNHRIVEWKSNANIGRIVAGGNGEGNQTNQLNRPTSVIIDTKNDFLIIADKGNRRVMRWFRQDNIKNGEIIISDIDCWGLTMDKDGSLYVSDYVNNEVRRYKRGERNGTIVAGGNGKGNQLNQLNAPTFIFVDDDYSLYVSDHENHRVMKWLKDAKVGTIAAGGNGKGDSLTQLYCPAGVIVDQFGQIYVGDCGNHRVMCWCKGAKEGTIIVGGNGEGEKGNQLNDPRGLSFDRQRNLYVVDRKNHRIQKFEIE